MAKDIEIGGRLHSTATGNVVTGANEILDDELNKKQSQINSETLQHVESIDAALQELSPDQTQALALATDVNTLKAKSVRGDETQSLTDAEKEQAISNMGVTGVYDISGEHPVSGHPKKYSTLPAALADVPVVRRKSGMSVKALMQLTQEMYHVEVTEGVTDLPTGYNEYELSEASPMTTGDYTYSELDTENFGTIPSTVGASVLYYIYDSQSSSYTTWLLTKSSDSTYAYKQYLYMQEYANTTAGNTAFLTASNWQGVDDKPTAGSQNLVKSGGVKEELALGAVYDVSAHNNGATFASLQALLSNANLNTLIPTSVRKGGMSIKFVQSSDNKYVQFFCNAQEFTTDISVWGKMNLAEEVGELSFDVNGGSHTYIENYSQYSETFASYRKWIDITQKPLFVDTTYKFGIQFVDGIQLVNLSHIYVFNAYNSSTYIDILPLFDGVDFSDLQMHYIDYLPQFEVTWLLVDYLSSATSEKTVNIDIKKYHEVQKESLDHRITSLENSVSGIDSEIDELDKEVNGEEITQIVDYSQYSETFASFQKWIDMTAKPLALNNKYQFGIQFADGVDLVNLSHIYLYSAYNTEPYVDIIDLFENIDLSDKQMHYVDYIAQFNVTYLRIMYFSSATNEKEVNVDIKHYDTVVVPSLDTRIGKLEFFNNFSLYGKTILFFGDSITQLPITGSVVEGNGIVEYIHNMTGVNAVRCAIGGGHLAARSSDADYVTELDTFTDPALREYVAKAYLDVVSLIRAFMTNDYTWQDKAITALQGLNRCDAAWPNIIANLKTYSPQTVDAIVIFAGTNDYHGGAYLGDVDAEIPYQINGAINLISKYVMSNNPKTLPIYWFTPIVRFWDNVFTDAEFSDVKQNSRGLTLKDYVDDIITQVNSNHIQVTDLYATMSWSKYNYTEVAPDGTHPVNGFENLARKMAVSIMSNLCR